MTSDSEKEGRRIVKDYFARKIAFNNERMSEYEFKSKTSTERNESTAMKAFYASSYISCSQHTETLEILGGFINTLFDVNDDLRAKISILDKTIQSIAEKTGVDISAMKTEVVDLKEVIFPAVKGIVNLLDRQGKDEERRKKNGATMIV